MSTQKNASPVIIKRKKIVAAEGHHGGAWKVAYADFVTAMMAFFLLMWLLNATTEKQRKGIADYFNPNIPINRISG
ncbi:MAG: chemotaxis protein MotB, partial [Rhodobacteraceae bacterium]|nr:chemotaxis protein MotB [Paracoccaceae bacterium]